MLLNLTDISSEPLHSQLSRQIREKALSGELKAGDDLPSIRNLASDCHVSVITVQRAYEDLLREGIIYSRRGKGFFVCDLSSQQKAQIALERLREQAAPVVAEALAAGLSEEQILETIRRLSGKD